MYGPLPTCIHVKQNVISIRTARAHPACIHIQQNHMSIWLLLRLRAGLNGFSVNVGTIEEFIVRLVQECIIIADVSG